MTSVSGVFRWAWLIIAVVSVVAMLLVLSVDEDGASLPAVPTVVRFSTGVPGAGFHPLGQALAEAFSQANPGVFLELNQSPGSVSNLLALNVGGADLGLAFADVTYLAYAAGLVEHDGRLDALRGIAVLHLTPLHLVVRPGSDINGVEDLRGKRVGLGPPGSGTALTATLALGAYGVSREDVRGEELLFTAAAERIVDSTLDAMFVNASYPAAAVRAALKEGARLVPVSGLQAEALRRDYPFFRQMIIPERTYADLDESVLTIGVDTVLLCRASLDSMLVYELTRTLFDVLPTLVSQHPSLRLIDVGDSAATPVPLHPGASRYYRERELSR